MISENAPRKQIVYRSTRTGKFISKFVAKRLKYLVTELYVGKKVYRAKGYRDKITVRKPKKKPALKVPKRIYKEPKTGGGVYVGSKYDEPIYRQPSEIEEEPSEEEEFEYEEEWQADYESDWGGLDYLDDIDDLTEDEEWYESS